MEQQTTETTQTTHFNWWQENFYLLFPTNETLKRNFKTDDIKTLMYNKHNEDNAKLRTFSSIPQWQRIEPNFMNHTYQTTKKKCGSHH